MIDNKEDDTLVGYHFSLFPLIGLVGFGVGIGFYCCKSYYRINSKNKSDDDNSSGSSGDRGKEDIGDYRGDIGDIEIGKNRIPFSIEESLKKRIESRASMKDLSSMVQFRGMSSENLEKMKVEICLDKKFDQSIFYKMKCSNCGVKIKGFSEIFCCSDLRFCSKKCRDKHIKSIESIDT